MRKYTYIDSDGKFSNFLGHLKQNAIDTLAMDFEGEFNLHAYGESLCLIQIFDGERYFIIDPYGVSVEILKTFLEDRKVLKLFFGAGSDVQLVFKQYKIVLNSVLDLQIMAEAAGYKNQGLSGLNEEMFGTAPVQKKKFQMHNWTKRPIDPEALDYALSDVAALFQMYQVMMEKIIAENKVHLLIRNIVLKTPSSISKGIPGIFKTEAYKGLSKDRQIIFEKLLTVREGLAKELNWPPENVLGKSALFDLINHQLSPDQVPRPARMSETQHKKFIEDLKAVLLGI